MKKINLSLVGILTALMVSAQSLSGTLTQHPLQTLVLSGFEGYNTLKLGETQADSLGNFSLAYPKDYTGMALLKTQDNNSLVLLLGGDPLTIQGTHVTETDRLEFNESQNLTFFTYALGQTHRKNALRAWDYLEDLYRQNKPLNQQTQLRNTITAEIHRLKQREQTLIDSLPPDSYLRWFIPYRSFIQDMPTIIRTQTERIPESIALFRTTDFNHPYWTTSGILQDLIEKHYFMLENSAGTVAEKQEKMNESSRHLLRNLQSNNDLLNTVVEQLFTFLEDRSLFIAAAFLATQALTDTQCEIQERTANKLEKYRHLKVGRKAPDIQLSPTQRLSDYQQPLLLVFGKSDCPHCKTAALALLQHYQPWKSTQRVEVVYISLDTDKQAYAEAYQHAPWPMFCDFKGWDSKAVTDYHVWGTPSYFLLDKDLTILAHINSVDHADAWIKSRKLN